MSEQEIENALKPFGWTCGPDFWKRYYADAWVFSLANVVTLLSARVSELEDTLVVGNEQKEHNE